MMQSNPNAKRARRPGFQSAAATEHAAANEGSESSFQVDMMPVDKIKRRTLHPYSVHYSLPSSCWIATIVRHVGGTAEVANRSRYSQFEFSSEGQAKSFSKAYSPPKMLEPGTHCFICKDPYTAKLRPYNCRNCGICTCEKCSTRWGAKMIPKTYVHAAYQPQVVRVCSSCQWLSNAHCFALLKGRFQDAQKIYDSGNVNLRTCFADIRGESMFPVHCATLGGNLELLKWLVDSKLCPISVKRDTKTGKMLSVKTSSDRTLVDLAMTGKPKLDILMYLVYKGLAITDLADTALTAKTLEALLKSGFVPGGPQSAVMNSINRVLAVVDPSEGSLATVENACNLCCEKTMDCVLNPCGHMMCCADCGVQLEMCPMCKAPAKVLRIIQC